LLERKRKVLTLKEGEKQQGASFHAKEGLHDLERGGEGFYTMKYKNGIQELGKGRKVTGNFLRGSLIVSQQGPSLKQPR